MLFVDIRPRGVRMCRPATDPPTPGWGYGYGQGWINTTRTRTLLYPGGTGTRVQQPVTIPTYNDTCRVLFGSKNPFGTYYVGSFRCVYHFPCSCSCQNI